jgi:hypothetical protein
MLPGARFECMTMYARSMPGVRGIPGSTRAYGVVCIVSMPLRSLRPCESRGLKEDPESCSEKYSAQADAY